MATIDIDLQEIKSITELTKNGKIIWIVPPIDVNQFYKWERKIGEKTYQISIQCINSTIGQDNYFFNVIKHSPSPLESITQLNSLNQPNTRDILRELWLAAEKSANPLGPSQNILASLIEGL